MIAWLETTSAATVGRSTSTASQSFSSESYETTTLGTGTDTYTDTTIVGSAPWYTYSDTAITSANYSGTTHQATFTSWGYSNSSDSQTATFVFVRSSVTHISNVASTSSSTNGGDSIGGQGQKLSSYQTVSAENTRSVTTSTTQTYATSTTRTQSSNSTIVRWSTSKSASNAAVVFYSTQIAQTTKTTGLTEATKTQDTTTTTGQTQMHYGHDNTIFQCRTSDAFAEIAWTMADIYTLNNFGISALRNQATTATRWTQSINNNVVLVTNASLSVFAFATPPTSTTSFSPISEEINYTTTTTKTGTVTYVVETASFPAQAATTTAVRTSTTNSLTTIDGTATVTNPARISVTYVPATTLSTLGNIFIFDDDNDAAAIFPTESVASWINSTIRYTTGNGTITWHELAAVPATFSVTRLSSVRENYNANTIEDLDFNTTRQGLATSVANNVLQQIAGFAGFKVGANKGLYPNINLGKSFSINGIFTAYDSRATNVSTFFPSTYSVTGDDFNGTLSLSGKSASATFVPVDTEQSNTTTGAMFSVVNNGSTVAGDFRFSVLGGTPAGSESFLQKWPLGVFANRSGATVSKAPTVSIAAQAQQTSWFEPVVGVYPSTSIATKTIVSYVLPRNRTALPSVIPPNA